MKKTKYNIETIRVKRWRDNHKIRHPKKNLK